MKGLYVIAILGLCLAFASAGRRHRKPLVCSITEAESVTESRECPMDRNCTAGPVSISLGEQNAEVHFCQKDDSSEEQETDEDEIMKRLSRAILRPACKVFNETHTLFERECIGENMECRTATLNIEDQTVAAKYCIDTTIGEFSYLEAFTGRRENIRPESDDDLFRPIGGDKDDERSEESEDRSGGRRGGRRGGRKGGRQRNRSSDSDESSVEDDTNEQRRFRGGRASRISSVGSSRNIKRYVKNL